MAESESPVRYSVGIKELPSDERPRERLAKYGPQALSTSELLAIVLRTGTRERSAISLAQEILKEHKGLRGVANASVDELARTKGIGVVKGVQIAACVELGRRLAEDSRHQLDIIQSPGDAANLFKHRMRDESKEFFEALLLDSKNRVLKRVTVSIGSLNNSIVHPREVFKQAIAASAAGIIVAHNHPSGDPTPSAEDRMVTARLVECGKLVGIDVLDHLIIGDNRWLSLKELGMM